MTLDNNIRIMATRKQRYLPVPFSGFGSHKIQKKKNVEKRLFRSPWLHKNVIDGFTHTYIKKKAFLTGCSGKTIWLCSREIVQRHSDSANELDQHATYKALARHPPFRVGDNQYASVPAKSDA